MIPRMRQELHNVTLRNSISDLYDKDTNIIIHGIVIIDRYHQYHQNQ